MFTLEYAKTPQWASDDGQAISVIVKWVEFDEEMPFCATSYDIYDHGKDLFNRAKAGEFGEIAAMNAPTQPQPQTTGSQTL
jgi:hypothetical protein